jgi:hypothetical protein
VSTSELFLPKKTYKRNVHKSAQPRFFDRVRSKLPFAKLFKRTVAVEVIKKPIPKDFTASAKVPVVYKVFKPVQHVLETESEVSITEQPHRFNLVKFAQPRLNLARTASRFKFDLPFATWLKRQRKYVSFALRREAIFDLFNRTVATIVIFASVSSLLYITLFDRYFLVKNYEIQYTAHSFLSTEETSKITEHISSEKMLGIIPANQYWFLNGENLTRIAKNYSSEVKSIEVVDRKWPNQAVLKVTTEPVLLTLGVIENGQKRYWRVGQDGEVVTEDTLNLREKLVTIDIEVRFDKQGGTLKNYTFSNNQEQKNRFWFVSWLWNELNKQGISITKTSFHSILDTDVVVQTTKGTKLLFSSDSMNAENQAKRIAVALSGTTIRQAEQEGKYSYIDFRIPKKVFVCERGAECDK